MPSVANPIHKVKKYFTVEKQQGEAGQHLAIGKVFKPVGWAKTSLARSASTSKGGRTGEKWTGPAQADPV
jgi:hypothetical protein